MQKERNHFNKIMLLNEIGNQLVDFAVNSINPQFSDYIDMNCGAIPPGSFQQVIDLSAPKPFLSLYTQISKKRFAFAVTEILNKKGSLKNAIADFCFRSGKALSLPEVKDAFEAFETYNSLILDGMIDEETKNIIEENAQKIKWKKVLDTNESVWKECGGDICVYYELLEFFVKGLFEKSRFELKVQDGEFFTLSKIISL